MVKNRIARVALALVVGVLVWVGAGTALAGPGSEPAGGQPSGEPTDTTLPDRPVLLPPQRMGDRMTYALDVLVEDDEERYWFNATLALHWNGTGQAPDGWGRMRPAEAVQATLYEPGDADDPEGADDHERFVYWVARGGDELLLADQVRYDEARVVRGLLPLPPPARGEQYTLFRAFGWGSDCILTFPVRTLGPTPVALAEPCTFFGIPMAQALTPVASADGLLRYTGPAPGGGQANVTFHPDIPYPVLLEAPATALDGDMEILRLRLVGFQAGTQSRGPAERPDPPQAPRQAPREPWGPSEEGFAHPFPASAAYGIMTGPQQPAELASFRARHQDAYVGQASHAILADNGVRRHEWAFVWAGGDEMLPVVVSAPEPETLRPLASAPVATVSAGEVEAQRPGRMFPPPTTLPATLPVLADLAGRWDLFTDDAPGPTGYGVSFLCDAFGCAGDASIELGRAHGSSHPVDGTTWDFSRLVFDRSGAASDAAVFIPVAPGAAVLPVTDPLPGPRLRDETPLVVPVLGAMTSALSPAAAAGAGALGLASAALTYFLASLKSGSAGLFSRILPSRLQEHPARRVILEAVAGEPGIHFKALGRRTGLANGNLVHHLRHLERAGLVQGRAAGGYTGYFPGQVPAGSPAAAAAKKSEGAKVVLEALRSESGLSGQELAARTGLDPSTVSYHARRLSEAGLVRPERDGKAIRFRLAAAAGQART